MPNYDLSSIGALAAASELAHTRADQEPSQDSYNAAWLHGYADALADAARQLEPRQELIDAVIGYMGKQYDSAELYAVLHDTLTMSDGEILSLGFDLPQCRGPDLGADKTQREDHEPSPEGDGCHITDRFTVSKTTFVLGRQEDGETVQYIVRQYETDAPGVYLDESRHDTLSAAQRDYCVRIEKAVTAHCERTGEEPLLPLRCMAVTPTGQLVNLWRGIHGYRGSDWSRSDAPELNRRSADLINQRMGVTKAQAEAMLCGSMFGWDSKLADPHMYDEQGKPIKKEPKKGKNSHER